MRITLDELILGFGEIERLLDILIKLSQLFKSQADVTPEQLAEVTARRKAVVVKALALVDDI